MISNHTLREQLNILSKDRTDIFEVGKNKWEMIIKKTILTFGNFTYNSSKDIHWLWNGYLKEAAFSTTFKNDDFYKHMTILFKKNYHSFFYFIIEDTFDKYWVYEATPKAIQELLPELPFFEYYIIDKKFHSLICENHHGVVYFVGDDYKMLK